MQITSLNKNIAIKWAENSIDIKERDLESAKHNYTSILPQEKTKSDKHK